MNKTKSNSSKHYNWIVSADMYLASSVLLAKELIKSFPSYNNIFNPIQQIGKKCGFSSSNPDYEILLPIVFNLKHGVELYLKALIMNIDKDKEYPHEHNLKKIIDSLNNKLKGEIELKNELIKLVGIINKYYYGTYAFTKEKNSPDINNEAERYPELRNKDCYEICNLFSNVNRQLIEMIIKDTQDLQKGLRNLLIKVAKTKNKI